jgi:hypothetical protein
MKGREGDDGAAGRCLRESVAGLTGEALERRHEALMEWAEAEGLDRAFAERAALVAEEEDLQPLYALLLVHCGIGVRELEPPEQDDDELTTQPTAPSWVEPDTVELEDDALERRLRGSFRRFRSHLEASTSVAAAVDAFLAEPDIGPVRLRW